LEKPDDQPKAERGIWLEGRGIEVVAHAAGGIPIALPHRSLEVESRPVPMRRPLVKGYGSVFSHMLRNIAFTLPWPSTSTANSPSGLPNF
jgi:hypothetical protein